MKIKRREGSEVRRVLAALVTDPEVLKAVAERWPKQGDLFDAPYANLVGGWCVEHWERYGNAINGQLRARFDEWASATKRPDETIEGVERFLEAADEEHEHADDASSKFLLDVAARYFNKVRLNRLREQMEELVEIGRVDEANALLAAHEPFSLNGKAARVVKLSEVERRKVSWLWRSWIPWGQLTIIDGDMGCGKTQIALDIAARVTRGWVMPPGGRKRYQRDARKPANVLILSSEDDAASTIGPRFDAAGGDGDRAMVLTPDSEGNAPMMFPQSFPELERLIKQEEIRLVIVDPFYGFLDGKVDSNTDHKVRVVMRFLSDIAQATGCAIVLIRHLNKKTDTDPLYRGGGSVGVAAACPAALIIGRDPENRDVRVLAGNRIKHAPMAASMAYTIEGFDHPEAGATSRVKWIGETELTASDILRPEKKKQGRPSKQDEIVEFIQGLFVKRKTIPATELEEKVIGRFGCSRPTFLVARKTAGVESTKQGMSGGWIVRLSGEE